MAANGSPEPVFYTDKDQVLFMATLPCCHLQLQGTVSVTKSGIKLTSADVELIFAKSIDFQSISALLDSDITDVHDQVRRLLVTKSVTKSVTKFIQLIDFLNQAKSRSEILNFLGIGNQTKNFTTNITPLLENGIIELTIPDKPQSRFQKYRLTEKGKKLLKQ